MLRLLSLVALQIAPAAPASAPAAPAPELRREELMEALRSGGYTILLRHGASDHSFQEDRTTVPVERSQQRNLVDLGVAQGRRMRRVLEAFHVPIGEIVSSPMYRTRETAEYAAGTPRLTMDLRSWPSTPAQAELVKAAPPKGTNRLLVTHHFVIETHAPGIRPGDIDEGEGVVLRPDGAGGVTLVGRLKNADWIALDPVAATAAPSGASSPAKGSGGYGAAASAEVAFPATTAGQLAAAYVAAYNSGDNTRMQSFLETSLRPVEGQTPRPMAERLASYRQLFEQFGTLRVTAVTATGDDLVEVEATGSAGPVQLSVRSQPVGGQPRGITIRAGRGGHH